MTEPSPEAVDAADGADAVVVRLGPGRYAAWMAFVAEVGRVPPVTRVPGVPAWLAGVANWRGRLLPVLDLRALLGAPAEPPVPTARLVVLVADGMTVGVVVDAVEGTDTVGAVDDVPVDIGRGRELLAGQVPRDDGPVAVLDVPAVLRLREGLPRVRRPA